MVNTTGKLASFWCFSITVVSASSISLATGHYSRAPRHYLTRPSPRWLLPDTDRRIPHELHCPILYFRALPFATASSRGVGEPGTGAKVVKDRTGPDLDEQVVYIQHVTEPGKSFGQINPFLPARHRPLVDHSLSRPEALNARGAEGERPGPPTLWYLGNVDGPQCLFFTLAQWRPLGSNAA